MTIVDATANRATCDRGKSGAVITKDNRILSAGYVGNASGMPHCDDIGHTMRHSMETSIDGKIKYHEGDHCISTVHAEINAIANAARNGVALKGATMYCTMAPCYSCAKAIVQCGIVRVIAKNNYQDTDNSVELFESTSIDFIILNDEMLY
jgi:dCMP deaminase